MKVLVAGNSVAVYVRPRDPRARPYARLLQPSPRPGEEPIEVELQASNSVMATDLVGGWEDRLLSAGADVVVLNLGIVECTPRVCPQQWRRRFVRGATRIERVWLAAEGLVRRPLVRLLGGATGTSVGAFEAAVTRLARVARDEGGARVFCLGIPPTSSRVVAEAPGIAAHIQSFDAALRRACQATGAAYLDTAAVVAPLGLERAMPDGIHFSAEGHAAVAAAVAAAIAAASHPPRAELPSLSEPGPPPAPGGGRAGAGLKVMALVPAALLIVVAVVWVPLVRAWRALSRREH